MSADLEELYQDLILDHYKHPRHLGCIEKPDAKSEVYNPMCGDQIIISISKKDNLIEEIKFEGKGCAISQASASMMADACCGRSINEIKELIAKFQAFMRGGQGAPGLEAVGGDLVCLQGVRKFSTRIKCALLAWEALSECIFAVEI